MDAKDSKTWLITTLVVCLAVGNLGSGINLAALENLFTITIIVVLPRDGGSPVMKSIDNWDHGHLGMGKGWSNPRGE